jgi:hypothetical protein
MAGKVGRPKREEEVTSILLRLPPALLKSVERCQTQLALQEDVRLTRTEAFWRILEAGCEAIAQRREATEVSTTAPAQMSIYKISEISGVDVDIPGYGFPEDVELPEPVREDHDGHVPQETNKDNGNIVLQEDKHVVARNPSAQHTEMPDKDALMARLQQMRASGLSLQQIADQLNAEGLPTLSSKGRWQKGTVAKLLTKHQTQPA